MTLTQGWPVLAFLATIALLSADSVNYASADSWLCRPGRADACAVDLTTTVLQGNGARTRETWAAASRPAIDCFYVYPTVSRDTSTNSDLLVSDDELDVVRQQFARFASICRPYAPIYRQVTIPALMKMLSSPSGLPPIGGGVAYDDVAAAWHYYLEHDNNGRGVVLIGHSQGARILQELFAREIDGQPVQQRIVSALLVGYNFVVPKGKDLGGTFKTMPICRRADAVGCVIAFSSFRSTLPPSTNALFSRAPDDGTEVVCTNPAALAGGSAALKAYFIVSGKLVAGTPTHHPWVNGGATFETPFISVPGLLTGECVSDGNSNRLVVTVHPDSLDPRTDDIPGDLAPRTPMQAQWGLHLVDINLTMGNLLDVVARQSKAFRSRQ